MPVLPNRVAVSVGAERDIAEARSRARAASLRGMVLASIVIGLLIGAIACAAGLGAGGHRATHTVAEAPLADAGSEHAAVERSPSPGSEHAGHSTDGVDPPITGEADPASSFDDSGRSAPTLGQGHPGMACVVSVDLRFPVPTAVRASGTLAGAAAPSPTGCVAELDPPIPRSS